MVRLSVRDPHTKQSLHVLGAGVHVRVWGKVDVSVWGEVDISGWVGGRYEIGEMLDGMGALISYGMGWVGLEVEKVGEGEGTCRLE